MWFLFINLCRRKSSTRNASAAVLDVGNALRGSCDVLVDIKSDERCIEEEGYPLTREKEQYGEEGMCDVFWQDELRGKRDYEHVARVRHNRLHTWLSLLQRSMGLM